MKRENIHESINVIENATLQYQNCRKEFTENLLDNDVIDESRFDEYLQVINALLKCKNRFEEDDSFYDVGLIRDLFYTDGGMLIHKGILNQAEMENGYDVLDRWSECANDAIEWKLMLHLYESISDADAQDKLLNEISDAIYEGNERGAIVPVKNSLIDNTSEWFSDRQKEKIIDQCTEWALSCSFENALDVIDIFGGFLKASEGDIRTYLDTSENDPVRKLPDNITELCLLEFYEDNPEKIRGKKLLCILEENIKYLDMLHVVLGLKTRNGQEEYSVLVEEERRVREKAIKILYNKSIRRYERDSEVSVVAENRTKAHDQAVIKTFEQIKANDRAVIKAFEQAKAHDQAVIKAFEQAKAHDQAVIKAFEQAKAHDQAAIKAFEQTKVMLKAIADSNIEEMLQAKRNCCSFWRECGDDEELLENITEEICAMVWKSIERDSSEKLVKDRVRRELEKYSEKIKIPDECIKTISTAEYLYERYMVQEEKDPEFDYTFVSVTYYSALESLVNKMIYTPYAKMVSSRAKNGSVASYFPAGEVKFYLKREKLQMSLSLGTLGRLLEWIEDGNTFYAFLTEERGVTKEQAYKLKVYSKCLNKAKDYRNNAAHGQKIVNWAEANEDKKRTYDVESPEIYRGYILNFLDIFL